MTTFNLTISINRTGGGFKILQQVKNLESQAEAIKIIAEPSIYKWTKLTKR